MTENQELEEQKIETISIQDQVAQREAEEIRFAAVDKLILDTVLNKYDVILLARRWAYELQSKEGVASRSVQDIIAQSLDDILSGKVSAKTVRNLPPIRIVKKPKSSLGFPDTLGKIELPPEEPEKEKPEASGKK